MAQAKGASSDQGDDRELRLDENPKFKVFESGTRDKPTFTQLIGWKFGIILLWVIVGFAVVTAIVWWATRPTLTELQTLLGSSVTEDKILALWNSFQDDHLQRYRDVFQLFVISALVPLFTLVAGYAFGSREGQRNNTPDGEGS